MLLDFDPDTLLGLRVTEPVIDPALIAQQMQAQVLLIGERTLSTPTRIR